MGTRSRIGVMHGNNCKSVYCHWDGYLDHNGRILLEHYDSVKANHLVALGDLSSLRENIGSEHDFDSQAGKDHKWCDFYGRDCGEEGVEFATDTSFDDFFLRAERCGAEFYYIMRDGVWYVGDTYEGSAMFRKLVPLAEALADQDIDAAETVSAE